MNAQPRHRLPSRRPSVTRKVEWQTETSAHAFYVTIGRDPHSGAIAEVFYGDGQKSGTQLRDSVSDACVLISMLLQRGARLAEIGHSLATAPLWGGEDVPASPVGAIVAEMQAEEGEA